MSDVIQILVLALCGFAVVTAFWTPVSRKQKLLERAAIAAMQGLLSDPEERSDERKPMESCEEATARLAVAHAKALMKEMGKK